MTYLWPAEKNPRNPTVHRIADIRQRAPFLVHCTCGWNATARDSTENEANWKKHKKGEL